MNTTNNPRLTEYSQRLRRDMTKEEKHLWYDFLKKQPETFNRQKVIGKYIVDFCCASKMTVIEIDGAQHFTEKGVYDDIERDAYLKGIGYTVLRYGNEELRTNFDGVCADIRFRLDGVIVEPQKTELRCLDNLIEKVKD